MVPVPPVLAFIHLQVQCSTDMGSLRCTERGRRTKSARTDLDVSLLKHYDPRTSYPPFVPLHVECNALYAYSRGDFLDGPDVP